MQHKAESQNVEDWVANWEKGYTGWKQRELTYDFSSDVREALSAIYGDKFDAKDRTKLLDAVKGRKVFVPLCGDTPAVKFYATEFGCHVVGVEMFAPALETIMKEHLGGVTFAPTEHDGGKFVEFKSTTPVGDRGGSVRLFTGDYFDVTRHLHEAEKTTFDLVLDRASMMAMHPEKQQPEYVAAIKKMLALRNNQGASSSVSLDGCVVLECVHRTPDTTARGPPYHMPLHHVEIHYPKAEFETRVVRDAAVRVAAFLDQQQSKAEHGEHAEDDGQFKLPNKDMPWATGLFLVERRHEA